ncbi:ATP-binding protein [Shewanella avicenniae]|uniref:ATP-binding protein n=1 Tax=Shewanella avicenniae TaxID=2814294 RepID=A0ABX7QSM5_9GAMM|nr:ATP-binding protein [Shewanella avicenniae]QSX34469.1 ATP-binding protein [Shewanella avicenniae]
MEKANYIRHPNPVHRGNPLVEGLGFPLSKQQVQKRCSVKFEGELDLTEVPEDLHGYYIRSSILNLFSVHVCQDEMVELYENIRLGIECGYIGRNPLKPDFQRVIVAIERDKDAPLKAQNIKRLNLLENSFTFLLSGLSGRGKSSMTKAALRLIPQHLYHKDYLQTTGDSVSLDIKQITYLYVEHHDRQGQKAFLTSILEAVDEATDETYAYHHRNSTVKELINAVRKALVIHHVGALIIDEAQNFAKASTDLKIGTNEKTSMKFVEELINTLGISTIFVGTFSALELFTREMTITRRTIRAGSMNLGGCPVDSPFWINLCHVLFTAIKLKGEADEEGLLRQKLYELSAGIPAIAVSMVQATLRFLSYYEPAQQTLTIDALAYVANKQFSPLAGPVRALLTGEYHKYEDLKPMLLLEEVNPSGDNVTLARAKEIEQQAQAMLEDYKEKRVLAGRLQAKQVMSSSSTRDEELRRIGDKLSPKNLLGLLGDDE